jgi:hypothetical protein
MNKPNQLANIVDVPLKELFVPDYYQILFPIERDRTVLERSIRHHGYLREHPIVIRRRSEKKGTCEIVAGFGRWKVMQKLSMQTIPAMIKEFSDEKARAYTASDNLQASETAAPISVVQAIVLMRDVAAHGGKYDSQLAMRAAGIKSATYRRAVTSLNYAIELLCTTLCLNLADVGLAELVHTTIKQKVWPTFTKFYTGELPVNTFKECFYANSARAQEQRRRQGRGETMTTEEAAVIHHIPGTSRKKQQGAGGEDREVFDTLLVLAIELSKKLTMNRGRQQLPPHLLQALTHPPVDLKAACGFFATICKAHKSVARASRPIAVHSTPKSSVAKEPTLFD